MTAEPTPTETMMRLRRAAQRMMDWRFHCWYCRDAIAVDGLLEADAIGVEDYRAHVFEILQRWHRHCLPNFDDALAPGSAILQLVIDGQLPAPAGERILGLLEGLPPAVGAVPALEPQRLFFRYGLCIDALYHLPATYAMAARWKSDPRHAERAMRIALDGMRALRCDAGWSQWFDPTQRRNNGVAWSRGLGWALLGLLDLIQLLEARGTSEIEDLSARILERLAATQGADGNWPAVLDHAAADTETSTASFYVAGALRTPRLGSCCRSPPSRSYARPWPAFGLWRTTARTAASAPMSCRVGTLAAMNTFIRSHRPGRKGRRCGLLRRWPEPRDDPELAQ